MSRKLSLLTFLVVTMFIMSCSKQTVISRQADNLKGETKNSAKDMKVSMFAQNVEDKSKKQERLAEVNNAKSHSVSSWLTDLTSTLEEINGVNISAIQTPSASFQNVTLAWNASSSPGITHYLIHFGTNGSDYTFVTNVGLVLTQMMVLPHRAQWFFAATAVDTNGVESPLSNQAQSDAKSAGPVLGRESWVSDKITP